MSKSGLPEGYTENFAKGTLKAYLADKKNLNWLIGMLRTSMMHYGLQSQELENIFSQLKDYGDKARWQEAYKRCQEEGWL